jgi:hypothetical protein
MRCSFECNPCEYEDRDIFISFFRHPEARVRHLSPFQKIIIWKLANVRDLTFNRIATKFGIHRATVAGIARKEFAELIGDKKIVLLRKKQLLEGKYKCPEGYELVNPEVFHDIFSYHKLILCSECLCGHSSVVEVRE